MTLTKAADLLTPRGQHEQGRRVLVVAAHADDEILGAGGSLAIHAQAGDELCFLVLSTSVTSRPDTPEHAAQRDHRRRCCAAVADLYGAQLHLGDFPDNAFDTVPHLRITQHIEAVVGRFRPTIVYTHSAADLSRDHQVVAHATATATRPLPGSSVRTVLAFEVRSSTEWGIGAPFQPTWFQPLTARAVSTAMDALDIYASEMRPWPHARSVDAVIAQLRFRGSHIGCDSAEGFEVIRHTADP